VVVLFATNDFAEVGNFKVDPYTYSSLAIKYLELFKTGCYPLVDICGDIFENGTINIDGSAPRYSQYLASQRVRTKYGFSLKFVKDEYIYFDNIPYTKYIGVVDSANVLHRVVLNATTSEYRLPYDAEVVFFVDYGVDTTFNELVGVKVSPGVLQRSIPKWENFRNQLVYLNKPNIIETLFPIGAFGAAHRGYSYTHPENTMPAFKEAVNKGFRIVETDVKITSDGVFVLLHDDTIDRTSNGSGAINQMTYDDVMQYDFGSWKGDEFVGTKICKLEDFLEFCIMTGVLPFLEIKFAQNNSNTSAFFNMLKAKGVWGKCFVFAGDTASYASYDKYIVASDAPTRFVQPLGFFVGSFTIIDQSTSSSAIVNEMIDLVKNGFVVMAVMDYSVITEELADFLTKNGIMIDVYTLNSNETILALPKTVKFVTSDSLEASKVWKDAAMS
jgi:glycerophosphoryl diester phosphodiesterase